MYHLSVFRNDCTYRTRNDCTLFLKSEQHVGLVIKYCDELDMRDCHLFQPVPCICLVRGSDLKSTE